MQFLVTATDTQGRDVKSSVVQADSLEDALTQGVGPGSPNALGLAGPQGRPEHAILAALEAAAWVLVFHEDGISAYVKR